MLMRKTRRLALASVLPLLAACVVDSRWPRIETQKAPAPMDMPRASTDEEWQRRAQLSMLLVPTTARANFWSW